MKRTLSADRVARAFVAVADEMGRNEHELASGVSRYTDTLLAALAVALGIEENVRAAERDGGQTPELFSKSLTGAMTLVHLELDQ